MFEETANPTGALGGWSRNDDDTIVLVTEASAKESNVSCEESDFPRPLKVAKNFLSIVPFGSTYFISDLPTMDSPALEKLYFALWDIVIQQDQAAGFFSISRTSPRRTSDTASDTAAGVINPRYCLATFRDVIPSRTISRAS